MIVCPAQALWPDLIYIDFFNYILYFFFLYILFGVIDLLLYHYIFFVLLYFYRYNNILTYNVRSIMIAHDYHQAETLISF